MDKKLILEWFHFADSEMRNALIYAKKICGFAPLQAARHKLKLKEE